VGIGANLLGYHSMDAVAAVIVGFMISKAGWDFSVEAFHGLTDHALDPEEIERIRQTILSVDGVRDQHGLRTRRMGDWAVIDVHIEVDTHISVSEGHYIAEKISARVKAEHRVAECTVHIDPGTVRHLERLLALPPRTQIQALVQQVVRAPVTLQLHYLDSGLEIEVELQDTRPPDELARLQQALHDTLKHTTRVGHVSLRCAMQEGRA